MDENQMRDYAERNETLRGMGEVLASETRRGARYLSRRQREVRARESESESEAEVDFDLL